VVPRLRDHQAEDPQLLHVLDELLGVGVRMLELAGDGPDPIVDPLAHDRNDRPLLRAEFQHPSVSHRLLSPPSAAPPAQLLDPNGSKCERLFRDGPGRLAHTPGGMPPSTSGNCPRWSPSRISAA